MAGGPAALRGRRYQNDIAVEVTPGVVDRFKVIDIDQSEGERLMIVHQRGNIAVEGAAVLAAGERVNGRLADVGLSLIHI